MTAKTTRGRARRRPATPGLDAASTIKARLKAQTRRRWARVAVVAAVVALVGFVVWAGWFSPWFVARSVVVTGTAQVGAEQIATAADVPLGTPLLRLDTAAIAAQVQAHPVVASVTIQRQLNGVVHIAVTERQPVYVMARGATFRVVDGSGVDYLDLPARPDDLPLVQLLDDQSPLSQRLMRDAAQVVAGLPDSVRARLAQVRVDSPDAIVIDLQDGDQILWGSAEQTPLKAEVIDSLLTVDASYYDVSSPSHPATR
jgi:cell division protein FtsQ